MTVLIEAFCQSVTVAGDKQVRVSDVGMALTSDGVEARYTTRDCLKGVLRCHSDRVKRIVTEDSPALFLTVSEVGLASSTSKDISRSVDSNIPRMAAYASMISELHIIVGRVHRALHPC